MGTLIDSSVLIAADRGRLDLDALAAGIGGANDALGLAAITVSEVFHGVHRLTGVRQVQSREFVRKWLAILPVIPFDLEVAQVHATLATELGQKGLPMGAHDLIIAATAVRLGYGVATRDRRSFRRIDGLRVEYW